MPFKTKRVIQWPHERWSISRVGKTCSLGKPDGFGEMLNSSWREKGCEAQKAHSPTSVHYPLPR